MDLEKTAFAKTWVLIPALNEELALPKVLNALPKGLGGVIVVDNGSKDGTTVVAEKNGAIVVMEPQRGYGAACLAGILKLPLECEIVVFLDGDFSDDPGQLPDLVFPIAHGKMDMVIGSRVLGSPDPGALLPVQRFGNALSTFLIRKLFKVSYTDLGPFRSIRRQALESLEMVDRDFGWTVEMQVRAASKGLKVMEVPVRYRKRIGISKVSGTIKGSILAGKKILFVIFREYFAGRSR